MERKKITIVLEGEFEALDLTPDEHYRLMDGIRRDLERIRDVRQGTRSVSEIYEWGCDELFD